MTLPETTSGNEPFPDEIIGIFIADASAAVKPNPSEYDGITIQLDDANSSISCWCGKFE